MSPARRCVPSGAHARARGRTQLDMVGRARVMREAFEAIRRVAPTDTTVLITGETGTGKELVARAVHNHSARVSGPFLAALVDDPRVP